MIRGYSVKATRWLVNAVLCLMIAACGGGGGGGDGAGGGTGSGPGSGGSGGGSTGGGGSGGGSSGSYSVSVSPSSLQFTTVIGPSEAMTQLVTASFVGDGLIVGYPPGVSQPSWLDVSVVGSPTSSPVQIQFTVPAATYNVALTLTTTVRFVSGKADGSQVVTQDVPVTLTIRDPFRLDSSQVELDATEGGVASSRSVAVLGQNISWTATPDQPWVQLSKTTGNSPTVLKITADTTGLAPGTSSANVRFSDSVSGTVVDLPVSLYVSANRWIVSRNGMMLLEFSDLSAPARTVRVTNDAGVAASWTATADVPWLNVTSGGANGDLLSVEPNVDAAALAADTVHIGTVTVTGAGLQQDKLRVGYYRSLQPAPTSYEVNMRDGASEALAVDPIRPYAYVSLLNGGDHLVRVNFATGAVDSILMKPGTKLRAPVVSGDGHFLYASDNNLPGGYHVYDLDADQPFAVWPRKDGCCVSHAVWVRTRGVPLLINNFLDVANADTGEYSPAVVPAADFPKYAFVSAAGNGTALYNFSFGTTNCEPAYRYEITSRPVSGQAFLTNASRIDGTAPSRGGSCVSVDAFMPSFDDSVQYFVGILASTYQALLRTDAGGLTEVSVASFERKLAMGDSGLKIVPLRGDNGMQVRVFGPDDTVVGPDFGHYFSVDDLALSNDERFALIVDSGNFDLQRLP